MKKLIALAAAITLSATSLFAWTNIITLGTKGGVPVYADPVETEAPAFEFDAYGIDLSYIGFFDFGLAIKNSTSIGLGPSRSHDFDSLDGSYFGPMCVEVNETFGVGYGIIRKENLFLGIFGTVGCSTDVAFAGKKTGGIATGQAAVLESFYLGTDVTAVYTPSKVFSIYASLAASVGSGVMEIAEGRYNFRDEHDSKDYGISESFVVYPYFKFVPTLGIAWKF